MRFIAPTSSRAQIIDAVEHIFATRVDTGRHIKRMSVTLDGVIDQDASGVQLSLFDDVEVLEREKARQEAVVAVKKRFGKNSLLSGIDLLPEATARERNEQLGGHRAGGKEKVWERGDGRART